MIIRNNIRSSIKDRQIQKTLLRGSVPHLTTIDVLNEKSLPYLMLNLPFSCNYRCLKCCNLTDMPKENSTHDRLTNFQLKGLIEEAGSTGFVVLVLAGEGEPLLDKEFRSVIDLASKNNLIPYIFTNGTMLNENNINFLAERRASLIINLDSMKPERYGRLSGRDGELAKVLSNIEQCRLVYSKLHEETHFGKVVSLAINTVATRVNVDEVQDVMRFCSDDIVFVCNRPTRIGFAEKNWELLYGSTLAESDVDSVLSEFSKEHGPLGSTADGAWCIYMKNGVSIGYDGSMLTCAYAIDTAGSYGMYVPGILSKMNAEAMASVYNFYREHGHSRCILRHPEYKHFVTSLKKQAKHDKEGVFK